MPTHPSASYNILLSNMLFYNMLLSNMLFSNMCFLNQICISFKYAFLLAPTGALLSAQEI